MSAENIDHLKSIQEGTAGAPPWARRRVAPSIAALMLALPLVGSTDEATAESANSDAPPTFLEEDTFIAETDGGLPDVYITFDDGPTYTTNDILDLLDQHPNVRVTFFVTCNDDPEALQRIVDSGHSIGLHTCTHPNLRNIPDADVADEFNSVINYINNNIDKHLTFIGYRPPYGQTDDRIRRATSSLGLAQEWGWNISSNDWNKPGVEYILSKLESMEDGDIVLLHDSEGKEDSVEAFRLFLEKHSNDYDFKGLRTSFRGQFYDDDSSIFESDIEWLAESDITRGCSPNKYCPDDPVTRAQVASFFARLLDLPATAKDYFSDDEGLSSHENDINRLAEAKITVGCAEDAYCPGDLITRAQFATMLVRVLGLTRDINGENPFVDIDLESSHLDDIVALREKDITNGCNPPEKDKFCPNDSVTRGQLAAFFKRSFAGLNRPE